MRSSSQVMRRRRMPSKRNDDQTAARKRKIAELTRTIRKKYLALKLGKSEEDESLNKMFKPISKPLEEIVKTSKANRDLLARAQFSTGMKKEEPPELKIEEEQAQQTQFIPMEEVGGTGSFVDDNDQYEYDDDILFNENITPEQSIPYDRTLGLQRQNRSDVWSDPQTSKWFLGTQEIDFDKRTGFIKIGGKQVRGTPGVYQLIFYDYPSDYNDEDLQAYKEILKLSDRYINKDGKLKGSKRWKYTNIIKPLIVQMRENSGRRSTIGSGLTYNENLVEYIYWDDPNELVDRLKLLIASKEAGNTSLDNEIVAIVNELREANLLY
ncbi:unnamed protein product [Phaedon cochleariae]|uniref:DUF8207 domain-containing protein n=1 Tax=Phaedon cochleariae TaxID=80249 RepID=A0A9N9SDK7_PHACE|nr:unnamed protein product [Phaedon cochleariae]